MSDPAAHVCLGRMCPRTPVNGAMDPFLDAFLPSLPADDAPVIVKFPPCNIYITKISCTAAFIFHHAMQGIFLLIFNSRGAFDSDQGAASRKPYDRIAAVKPAGVLPRCHSDVINCGAP
jgi:hypothetical protein